MDPVTLILAALAAGAGTAVLDEARDSVKAMYARLVTLVRERLGESPTTEVLLAEYERDHETYEAPLRAKLIQAGAANDEGLVAAAQQLLALLDTRGARAGKYVVNVEGSQGVQIGDHNTQTNTFGR
jgi:hypothetical protein